jgi:hypothetical protein
MSFFSRRGDTHSSDDFDNYSTLGHKNTIRPWSQSPPQEIITSLWQLPKYGYDLSNDPQETLSSTSSNSSDSSVSAVYGDEDSMISSYDDGSISPQDAIELGESSDSGSIISQTSSTRATRGSSRATSPLMSDGVPHHATHNMNTPQRHKAASKNHKLAKSLPSYPVISFESPIHKLAKKGMGKGLPHSSTISPTGRPAKFTPQSKLHRASSLLTQDLANSQLNESGSCCIGVLSAFEERYMGEEDKEAILQGGCHGLCDSQLSTIANGPGDHEADKTDSGKSSPCLKSPHEKRARFISSMPSAVIADSRRGTYSTQPRFPHRRVAAQYKQPRQPLPLVKHDSKRQNFKGVINQYVLGCGASIRQTDESNSQDKNKSSRGRNL